MRNLKTVLLLSFLLFSQVLCGQETDETIIRKIAGYILENTESGFVNAKNGDMYKSTPEIPPDAEVTLLNTLSEWQYANGVLNIAMVDLADFLGEEKYFDYAARQIAFGMDNYRFFQERLKSDQPGSTYPFWQLWTMSELDDCGAMGAGMIEICRKIRRDDYLGYINKTAKHITAGQERLDDGTLVRVRPHEMTLWADDLYMSVPFLARMGQLSGNRSYFDDAVLQVKNFTKYLWDPLKMLYYHCYYTDLGRNGVAHWGRCNGWMMMAKTQLLNLLPGDHPGREEVRLDLERQILGIAKYQSGDGLWHQLLDKNDSYTETSCTAMFVYAVARAVNQKWIDKRYATIALRGWEGLVAQKITAEGQVRDVCVGTGIQENLAFYYQRPTTLQNKHGLGPVLEAGMEVIRLKKMLQ